MNATGFLRYWPRWAALVLVLALIVGSIKPLQNLATIRWVKKNGGDVVADHGWLSRQLPVKARTWLNKKFQTQDCSPFDTIHGVYLPPAFYMPYGSVPPNLSFHRLARLPDLRSLSLECCEYVDDDDLKHLRGLRNLEDVALSQTKVTDAGFEYLKRTSKIKELWLSGTGIRGDGLVHLQGNENLKYLDLRETGVTSEAAVMISRQFQKLENLELAETGLTDEGLAEMEVLPNLYVLSTEGSKITDAGLVHFRKFPKLTRLSIGGAGISDAGLEILAKQTSLTEIYIFVPKTNPGVTRAGIEKFYEMRNDCRIFGNVPK